MEMTVNHRFLFPFARKASRRWSVDEGKRGNRKFWWTWFAAVKKYYIETLETTSLYLLWWINRHSFSNLILLMTSRKNQVKCNTTNLYWCWYKCLTTLVGARAGKLNQVSNANELNWKAFSGLTTPTNCLLDVCRQLAVYIFFEKVGQLFGRVFLLLPHRCLLLGNHTYRYGYNIIICFEASVLISLLLKFYIKTYMNQFLFTYY